LKNGRRGVVLMNNVAEIIRGRLAMYSFLSTVLLDVPPREFLQDLMSGEIVFPSNPVIDEGAAILGDLASKFDSVDDFETFVKQEFTAVFIGPFSETTSPYQSTYEGDSPYREVTARIKRRYLEMGYVPQKTSEPADHIGVELAFMAESCREMLENETVRKTEIKKQKEFLKEELLKWVFRFCESLENNPNAQFYRGIAKILRGFMEIEKKGINDLHALLR
jgi:TorA maturation chaperone TorD